MKRGMSRKGQMHIPFGMIFSIILIIAFIAVAFYAIRFFLGLQKCTETGMFKQDLQEAANKAWTYEEYEDALTSNLPTSLDYVCFVDLSEEGKGKYIKQYENLKKYGYINLNMFFSPLKKACEGQRAFMLEHLNITHITKQDNPYCVENVNGKVELKIEKGFDDVLVKIS